MILPQFKICLTFGWGTTQNILDWLAKMLFYFAMNSEVWGPATLILHECWYLAYINAFYVLFYMFSYTHLLLLCTQVTLKDPI